MFGGWLLATWFAFVGGDELVLAPGGVVESIGPGPIVRYVADRDGPVTFALDSIEMDAFLCVTDEAGLLTAAADDGGIRQNARVVVDLRTAQTVWIECTTMNVNRWSGRFTLSARAGDVPPPAGAQKDAIEGEFYRAYAGRYLVMGDPVHAAGAWRDAARRFLAGGSFDRARAAAVEAATLASAIGRPDLAIPALVDGSLASERAGDCSAAIDLATRAFDLATEHPNDALVVATTAGRLGRALLLSGRLIEARLVFEFGRDHCAAAALRRDDARFELGLAQVAHRDESLERATQHLEAAKHEALLAADDELQRAIDLEFALLAYRRARLTEAKDRLLALCATAEVRGDRSTVAQCRATLGQIHMHGASDYDAAEREIDAAIVAFDEAHDLVNVLGARHQRLQVRQRRFTDDGARAAPSPADAARHEADLRALIESAYARDAVWVGAWGQLLLAEWCAWTGSDAEALALAEHAQQAFTDRVGSAAGALSARRLQAVLRLRRGDTEFAMDVLDAALAHHAANDAARELDDAIGDRLNAEAWSRLALDVAAARVRAGADPAREFVRCAVWRDRALFSGISPADLTADAERFVARAWPPATRFVEFARGSDACYAFVAGGGPMRWLELGSWRALEKRADEFTARVRDPRSDFAALRGGGRALFDALLAPVRSEGAVERIVLSPGEGFALLPFDALIERDPRVEAKASEVAFAVRSLQIDLTPSWRAWESAPDFDESDPPRRIVVVGDPRPTQLGPLPGARREAEGIAELARSILGSRADVELMIGEAATRDRLLAALATADSIHVAAHAQIDWNDPARTGILLANHERLTLHDLRTTRLRARLTVLSTCASAGGQPRNGSGLLSVTNAFLGAGSRGVIGTRFPVDDAATDLFQRRFYRALWERGLTPSAALRAAKLESLDDVAGLDRGWSRGTAVDEVSRTPLSATGHPSRWAAFAHWGTGA